MQFCTKKNLWFSELRRRGTTVLPNFLVPVALNINELLKCFICDILLHKTHIKWTCVHFYTLMSAAWCKVLACHMSLGSGQIGMWTGGGTKNWAPTSGLQGDFLLLNHGHLCSSSKRIHVNDPLSDITEGDKGLFQHTFTQKWKNKSHTRLDICCNTPLKYIIT